MPLRRRRPVLRAAAVGGGAYAIGKRRAERAAEAQQMQAAPAEQGAGGLGAEDIERLQQLARLHEQGVITDQELAEQKARILG